MESDALNVITAVQGVPSLDDTSVVLDDVHKLLASLNGPIPSHIRMSANHVAHLLSHFTFNFCSLAIWVDETLKYISRAIFFDSIIK